MNPVSHGRNGGGVGCTEASGNPCFTRTTWRCFWGSEPSKRACLYGLRRASDAPGAAFQAHTLRGAAAAVSAGGLRTLAQAIERAGSDRKLNDIGELLPRAAEEFARFKSTVQNAGWV